MAYYYRQNKKLVHNECFPETFRMLIVGPSGFGKTSLLMRMLLEDGLLNYGKLYIFAKSLYQPEYRVLQSGLEHNLPKSDIVDMMNSDGITTKQKMSIDDIDLLAERLQELAIEDGTTTVIEYEFSSDPYDIPDPADLDKSIRNLIVFDDVMTERKQTTAENYYTRGRSANCDCIYLSQNYTLLPPHTIRANTNFMIFFKSPPPVISQLFRNFGSLDMEKDEFKRICKKAWDKKYGYLVIDLSRDFESGNKYRTSLELV